MLAKPGVKDNRARTVSYMDPVGIRHQGPPSQAWAQQVLLLALRRNPFGETLLRNPNFSGKEASWEGGGVSPHSHILRGSWAPACHRVQKVIPRSMG